ncbi:MAG: malate/lactate/ureidoglycolate dehydrogenase [Alphaproteobacteria bacterium]|nr:malate/lactate/ureidoglycolate dehydrogenase [Alphaproteobacteria bacterium]
MKTIDHQKLRTLTAKLLQAGGSSVAEASSVADHLVDANLAGHDSHGVGMIPHYVRNLKAGSLKPNQKHEVVSETGSFAVWDGHGGYGQVIAREAMEWAIGAARQHGVAVHALRNTHHIGRVGAYGELCAASGLTSLHFVNGNSGKPLVAPYRGREGRFSTNPVCIAIPGTATTKPFILDMATSRIALGKVRVAHNEGKRVVEGALIDENGKMTTDPGVIHGPNGVATGAVLPFGEHKGYGLALVCEILAGAVAGSGTIQPGNPRDRGIVNGMLSFVLDPARLTAGSFINSEIDAFIQYVKSVPQADPALPVLIPGEPERISRAARIEGGIPIDDTTWRQIDEAAASLGINFEVA